MQNSILNYPVFHEYNQCNYVINKHFCQTIHFEETGYQQCHATPINGYKYCNSHLCEGMKNSKRCSNKTYNHKYCGDTHD